MRLYHLYQSKCLSSHPKDSFYLWPLLLAGHHTLDTTVSRICRGAGIKRFKTDCSLHATIATLLFSFDEQLIIERKGLHSTDGIQIYKCTSAEQQVAMSNILSQCKKIKRRHLWMHLTHSINYQRCRYEISHSQKQLLFHPDHLQRKDVHIQQTLFHHYVIGSIFSLALDYLHIIESVDSISRDSPDITYIYVIP